MKRIGLVVVCILAACGTETGTGVRGQEAELHCRAWCDSETGCGLPNPVFCMANCIRELASACGELEASIHDCMMSVNCNDERNPCGVQKETRNECLGVLAETCAACPEGTVQGNCNPRGESCFGCYVTGGNCNVTTAEGRCRVDVGLDLCADFGACVENNGDCPLETLGPLLDSFFRATPD